MTGISGATDIPVRALLVGDRRFSDADGKIYTEGPTGAETGERYLEWFDRITVAGRRGKIEGVRLEQLNPVASRGLNVVYLPDISGIGRRLRNLAAARRTLRELVREADAVIARMPTELGLEAARLALEAHKPLAIEIGGCVLDGMRAHGSLAGRLYASIAYHRMRVAVGHAQWVSYVTQSYLQARYPTAVAARTLACSNVEIPEASVSRLKERLARLGSGTRPLTFGTIGSLHGQFKGIQHALAALARATPRLPPFRYRVLGGGDPAPWQALSAQHGLSERVSFDGALPAGEPVLRWLDGIDVYLQPSLREGLPRALIEAMSRACPVVASDIAGIPELLPPEALHPPGDVTRLAALIEQVAAPEIMAAHARMNWIRAQQFTRPRLNALRGAFWSEFRDSARSAKPNFA